MSTNQSTPTQDSIQAYTREGERKTLELKNRGPIRFTEGGQLDPQIVDVYREYGFYVFQDVIGLKELEDLRSDFEDLLDRAPHTKGAAVDRHGRPAVGVKFEQYPFQFSKPLSDPVGGTGRTNNRHEVKMYEPEVPDDAPEYVISKISGPLHLMDSFFRLYGHPHLLAVAEAVNGPDFTPFAESIIVKPEGLGASASWHQDGTTQWDKPDWDEGTHGFNFMAQLYTSTSENGLWVIPGSHNVGKIDIRKRVAENGGSDRLPDAIPLVCEPGDVAITNRQALHASYSNTSPDRRVSYNFGFHRKDCVLGVKRRRGGEEVEYTEERIHKRSRLIALAIDARRQRFPEETPYVYQPLVGEEDQNLWIDEARDAILMNYNRNDLGL